MIAKRLEICKENSYLCLLKNQSKFKAQDRRALLRNRYFSATHKGLPYGRVIFGLPSG
jgi:hypothetical protein